MKFSVLIPTRNRLMYLPFAVESVLRQDYADWEIIVYDNCSDEDLGGYVRSLNDPRVLYFRTDHFVSATENWNNAIERSTGDYVVMIGDDDILMRGYFTSLLKLLGDFPDPDLIYTGALLYAYPGVMPFAPAGYLATHNWASFLRGADKPYWLDRDQALSVVRRTMNFQARIDYNAQFAVLSRRIIRTMHALGRFYQGPFPDYYAMTALFLEAQKILVYPAPLVTIGVTPKSHGYYVFNDLDVGAGKFLNSAADPKITEQLEGVLLPGSHINTGWLVTMETVARNYAGRFDLRPSHVRYRLLQFLVTYRRHLGGKASAADMRRFASAFRRWELVGYAVFVTLMNVWSLDRRRWLVVHLERATGQFRQWIPKVSKRKYRNVMEIFEDVDPAVGLSS
jgi:glycosyltransferase involved in cell wall biosynthesis